VKRRPESEGKSAYQRALGLLARREQSARELTRKLEQRGHGRDETAAALDQLRRERYQDDERFAAAVIARRVASGYGPRVILAELRSHGIGPELARKALAEIDWNESACALARRRMGAGADAAGMRRVAQWLMQRGFPIDAIRRATRVALVDD
jgi:regulatory protein